MKILTVAPYYKPAYIYGGPARSVAALCEGMERAGAHVTVYSTNANGSGVSLDIPVSQAVNIDGVSVLYFPLSDPFARLLPFCSLELYRACRENVHEFDIVYIIGNWTYNVFAAARTAYLYRIPYVLSPRGSLMDYCIGQKALKKRIYLSLVERKLIKRASSLHVSSRLEETQLGKLNFYNKTVIIPNPVNLNKFETLPSRGAFREILGLPQDAIVSLYVGRLHKQKRISLTVEAFAHVSFINPKAYLIFVGPDEDGSGKAAQLQAQNLGIAEKIQFAGLLKGDELLQAYADADLLILLSCSESFGMAAAEAMAAGLPILVSREVGLAEEAQEAGAGFAVNAIIEDVVVGWLRILEDPNRLKQMGIRSKLMARSEFDIDHISDSMISFFEAVIQNNNRIAKEYNVGYTLEN